MKIDNLPGEEFAKKEILIGDEKCYLIFPRKGFFGIWTKDNLIFRSSIWNSNLELISASFKKFFNFDENPELNPPINGSFSVLEKLDGSTLIVSKYKGNLIVRTRGTSDVSFFIDSSDEIDLFKSKYPEAFNPPENMSYIFEWESIKNQIVLKYKEPDIKLINIVNHEDYSYRTQNDLDLVAKILGVSRPQRFTVESGIDDLKKYVKSWIGKEGVCIYYNRDQNIKKIKSDDYLLKHSLKSELDEEGCLDLYLKNGRPSYHNFLKKIEEIYDWEISEYLSPHVSRIIDANTEVLRTVEHMKTFLSKMELWSRKAKAEKIIASYGKTNRSGMVFQLIDNPDLTQEQYKKLYMQILNK